MKNTVFQLSLQGTQLEIVQNSFHLCGGDGADGKVSVSWMNLQPAAAQQYYV